MQEVDKQESVRPFVMSILFVAFTCLSSMALFNWWTNPFAAFNHPVRPGVNDHFSRAFYQSPRDQQIFWLIHRGRQTHTRDILLGASQTLFGIDTCKYPQLERLGLFGLQEGETAEFLRATETSFAPGTRLFINLTYAGPEVPLSDDRGILFWWHNLMQGTTTTVGIANLWSSRGSPRPACSAGGFPTTMKRGFDKDTLGKQRASASEKRAVHDIFEALTPFCERGDIEITLFNLPVNFDTSVGKKVYDYFQYENGLILAAKSEIDSRFPSCKLSFKDLGSEYTVRNLQYGPPQNDWWDTTHFKPIVGDELLKKILE